MEPPRTSESVVVAVELVFIFVVDGLEVREVDLVPEETADTTEALDELRALLRAVGDELEVRAELLVLIGEPLEQRLGLNDLLHLEASGLVDELLALLLLLLVRVDDDLFASRIAKDVAGDVQALPDDQGLHGTKFEGLEGVVDTEAVLAGILADLVEVALNELLLLYELDVR